MAVLGWWSDLSLDVSDTREFEAVAGLWCPDMLRKARARYTGARDELFDPAEMVG